MAVFIHEINVPRIISPDRPDVCQQAIATLKEGLSKAEGQGRFPPSKPSPDPAQPIGLQDAEDPFSADQHT
jgi:hypothetical protein